MKGRERNNGIVDVAKKREKGENDDAVGDTSPLRCDDARIREGGGRVQNGVEEPWWWLLVLPESNVMCGKSCCQTVLV